MAYYPVQVEKIARALRDARRANSARRRVRGELRRRGAASSSTSSSRTAARCAPSARAPRPTGERAGLHPAGRGVGRRDASPTASAMVDSPAYRLNHEEVIKALEEGIASREPDADRGVPDETAHVKALIFEQQIVEDGKLEGLGDDRRAAGADACCVAAGTTPNITYEKERRARSSSTRRRSSSSRTRPRRTATAASTLDAGSPTASSPRTTTDGRFVTLLRRQPPALRRQRRQGDGLGEGRLSARRRAVRARARGARPGGAAASATRRGRR